jgi:hypothetical protein
MFKVSKGNSKLGRIYNINLPAITSCASDAPCKKSCYANKGTFKYKNVRECYQRNLATFLNTPSQAELDILLQLPHVDSNLVTLYCRIHTSGDFYNLDYLKMIVNICNKRPYIKFMAFTKKYELINNFIDNGGVVPDNLTIIFSHWEGYNMPNKHLFPCAYVKEFTNVNLDSSFECAGLCEICYKCWMLKSNESVYFHKH